MAIYIRDDETEALIRALARSQKCGLTNAVKGAVREKLRALEVKPSLHDRLREVSRQIARAPKTGKKADKRYFDEL
jgi:hypothetical protein